MPDLAITIEQAEAVPFAASPMLAFRLKIVNSDLQEQMHTVVLRSQIQIEVARRRYTADEQKRLRDLFGEPERWGQTLRNLLWANTSTVVPQFMGSTTVDVQVPCTFDFTVATTKYFAGLADGDIPVLMMFSGTVFYAGESGAMAVSPIPWEKEARFRVPISVWNNMMATYYPNTAWLCLRRDVFDQVQEFKMDRGIPTFEQALEALLASQGEEVVRR